MRTAFLLAVTLLWPAASWAQATCTADARQVVNAAYLQVLERPVDRQVTEPLVARLQAGETSVREIVRTLALSPEHRQRFLTTNTPAGRNAAITALYRQLLARQPDEAGLQAHAAAFSATGDPTAIVNSLIDSSEYQKAWGDDTVPGGRVRYCGPASPTSRAVGQARFTNMDRNNDGQIERNEWTGSRASFTVHDWNGDGVLSGDEVRSGSRRSTPTWGESVDFDPAGRATWTDEAFRQLDVNRDNRVTSNEWYYNPEFFLRADRNRDGTLTPGEFTGESAAWDDDRDDQFDNLDVNNNGRVERSEWHGSLDAFQWLDRNRDNVLSRTEVVGEGAGQFDSFTTLDANRNGSLTVNEWRWSRASFNRYDRNGDGVLSRQEFAAGGGTPGRR